MKKIKIITSVIIDIEIINVENFLRRFFKNSFNLF